MAGILRPVLDDYGVPFFPVHGFNSATKMHDLAEEIGADERRTMLLYVGDYDPSGMYMSEEDLPWRLAKYGAGPDYTLKRIALTNDDINSLPSFEAEAKKKDPRFNWFVSRYGRRCWELDAMNPNDLRDRVKHEIELQIEPDDWAQHKRIETVQRETTRKIAAAMSQANVY